MREASSKGEKAIAKLRKLSNDELILCILEIEMSLTKDELARAIEICRHMIGLDNKRPYHRHGKAFYRAYRNYYTDTAAGNRILDKLPEAILRTYKDGRYSEYHLTRTGLAWLGRQLKITITER